MSEIWNRCAFVEKSWEVQVWKLKLFVILLGTTKTLFRVVSQNSDNFQATEMSNCLRDVFGSECCRVMRPTEWFVCHSYSVIGAYFVEYLISVIEYKIPRFQHLNDLSNKKSRNFFCHSQKGIIMRVIYVAKPAYRACRYVKKIHCIHKAEGGRKSRWTNR